LTFGLYIAQVKHQLTYFLTKYCTGLSDEKDASRIMKDYFQVYFRKALYKY